MRFKSKTFACVGFPRRYLLGPIEKFKVSQVQVREQGHFVNYAGWKSVLTRLSFLRFWTSKWSHDSANAPEGVTRCLEVSIHVRKSRSCLLLAWDMWRPKAAYKLLYSAWLYLIGAFGGW